jgi:hypothetical protein
LRDDVLALLAFSTYISLVNGLRCLAMFSSRSCACMILDIILSLFAKSTGIGKLLNSNSLLIVRAYPTMVANLEWQSKIRFSPKQATIRS